MAEHPHTNLLIHETSPYLLQHAHNPVDWHPWNEEALGRARQDNKPILLSVGYSACHWCHVMERESFENEEIARLMNENFVCIKVDREERPDIDQIYMNAVQIMTGQGGWPMTVFLTPDGKPFYGGTYYPPNDMYGRPGFPRILNAVAEAWQNRRTEVEIQAESMLGELRRANDINVAPAPILPDLFDRAYENLRGSFDLRYGGFGGAPKFPQPMTLDFLLRYQVRSRREEPLRLVELTLEKMAHGGMYDQIGGGFHRYSTDEYWLVPHFEKMLYDNAQLARTYLHAYQVTRDAFYRRIVEETLDYVLREMTSPVGAFYSAQDADSEGVEGKFFVWTPSEVAAILGQDEAELFCPFYDITERGNFEGKSIPNVQAPPDVFAGSLGIDPAEFNTHLSEMKRRMFEARENRVKPFRDEKVLADWNGLMLAALADAGACLENQLYLHAATSNAAFVRRELWRDGRLFRTGKAVEETGREGEGERFKAASIPGFLEDYSFYAFGLVRLYQATFERRWLDWAIELADQMIQLFGDPDGGFYNTAHDSSALIDRPRDMMDNAIPAGNTVAVELLLHLGALTGRSQYTDRAAGILRKLAGAVERHPLAFGRLLCAADFYVGPVKELAIIGPLDDDRTIALSQVVRSNFQPNLVTAYNGSDNTADSAVLPVLSERPMRDGKPTAYLCENYACQQPTTDPEELARQLAN